MATDLTGLQVRNTYNSLLKIGDNSNLTGTAKRISDGLGNDSPLFISTSQISIGVAPATGYDLTVNSGIRTGSIDVLGAATAQSLQFTGGSGTQATMSWNTDEETVDLIQNGATLQLGQETHVHVKNQTGSTINDGTPVYVTGTLGASGRLTVAPMIADGSIPAKYFLGVTTEDIPNGEDGKVTTFGKIRGLDTTAYTEGQTLYVSSTTAGFWQTTPPASPALDLEVAIVINVSANNGTIFVRAQNGYYLGMLHDVYVSTPGNNDILSYNSTIGRWENKAISGISSINLDTVTDNGNTTTNSISVGDINAGNVTLTGYLRGAANFVIDPAAHGDDTGVVQILGDLRVDGTTTTINSTTVTINDKNIVLAEGSALPGDANGAGITIDGADASMTYNSTSDRFVFNKDIETDLIGNVTGNVTGDLTGNADTATTLETARNIAVDGAVTGNADFDGSANITITTTVNHNHDDRYYTETESDSRFVNVDGDTMTGDLDFNDDVKAKFGTGDDLTVYHNATNSLIDNATGSILIRNLADDQDIVLVSDDGAGSITDYLRIDGSEGSVNLYHYGSKKLETTATGVSVTGAFSGNLDTSSISGSTIDINGTTRINLQYNGTTQAFVDSTGFNISGGLALTGVDGISLTDEDSTTDSYFHANIDYDAGIYTVTSNARYGADYIQVDGLDSRSNTRFTISPKDIGSPDPFAYLYIGGNNSNTAPNTLVDWHTIYMNALSVKINNNEVATQSWVISQSYLTTEADTLQSVTDRNSTTSNAITVAGLTSGGNIQANGWLQSYGLLYTRSHLEVLNAAGNGWNRWATRTSAGVYNLNVGNVDASQLRSAKASFGNDGTSRIVIGEYDSSFASYEYGALVSNQHADVSIGSNLKIDDNHDLVTINTHGAIKGSAIVFGGNSHPNQSSTINFYTKGQASATAGDTYTAESAEMTLKNGSLGIGTVSPSEKLEVAGIGKFGDYALIGTSTVSGYYQDQNNGAYRANGSTSDRGYYFQNYGGGVTTMYIGLVGTYASRVGIGTTFPSARLTVATGTPTGAQAVNTNTVLAIDSSANQYLEFRTTATNTGLMQGILFTDNGQNAFIGYKEYSNSVAGTYGEALHLAVKNFSATDPNNGIYFGTSATPEDGVSNVQMFIKGDGKVGIGTDDPSRKFHVSGNTSDVTCRVDTTNADPNFTLTTLNQQDWSMGIDYSDSGKLKFDTSTTVGSATKLTITGGGNVGIGSTTPNALLSVGSGSLADSNVRVQISTGGAGTQAWYGVNKDGGYGLIVGYTNDAGTFGTGSYYRNVTSDPMYFVVNNTTLAMAISSAGEVSVGSTVPLLPSAGRGNLSVNGSSNSVVTLGVNGSWSSYYYTNGSATFLASKSGTPIHLEAGGSTKLTIADNGNVGIGIGTGAPAGKLHVYGGRLVIDQTLASQSAIQFNHAGTEMGVLYRAGGEADKLRMFITGAGDVMTWTNAGRVGISRTSPSYTLDVNGIGRFGDHCLIGTNIAAGYYHDDNNGAFRANGASGNKGYYFQNYGGGSTTMFVGLVGTYAGRVGIGTTSPSATLSVGGSISGGTISSNDNVIITKGASDAIQQGSSVYLVGGSGSSYTQLQQGVGRFIIFGYNGSAWGERMTIKHSNGYVGIGVTSPSFKFETYDSSANWTSHFRNVSAEDVSVYMSHGSGYGMAIDSTENNTQYIFKAMAGGASKSKGSFPVIFAQHNGEVGFGTSSPNSRVHVAGRLYVNNGSNESLMIDTTVADTTTRDAIYLTESNAQATGRQAISWHNGNMGYYKARLWTEVGSGYGATQFGIDVANDARTVATRLYIRNGDTYINGKLTASNDVIAFSDKRVKENIKTVENALDKVLSMRGVYYNRIDQDDKTKKVGVIAQEIEKVLPEVVTEDAEGMKGVAYGNIVGVLIEAIKELKDEVNELKARLDGSTK